MSKSTTAVLALTVLCALAARHAEAGTTEPAPPPSAHTLEVRTWETGLRHMFHDAAGDGAIDWYHPTGSVCPTYPFDPDSPSDATSKREQCERETGKSCTVSRGRGAYPAC